MKEESLFPWRRPQTVELCIYCQDSLYERRTEELFVCGHVFHHECLQQHRNRVARGGRLNGRYEEARLESDFKCPVCREVFPEGIPEQKVLEVPESEPEDWGDWQWLHHPMGSAPEQESSTEDEVPVPLPAPTPSRKRTNKKAFHRAERQAAKAEGRAMSAETQAYYARLRAYNQGYRAKRQRQALEAKVVEVTPATPVLPALEVVPPQAPPPEIVLDLTNIGQVVVHIKHRSSHELRYTQNGKEVFMFFD